MKIKLALSGRIFEQDYKENIPLEEFVEIASEIGYQGIELRRTQVSLETPSWKVEEYVEMIRDSGLEVVCMETRGYPVLEDENIFIRFLELAKKFDCQIIKMGGDPVKTTRCAEIAAGYGIRLGLNNHIGTEEKPGWTETIERTVAYLGQVNHPNFGILYDACHLFMSGSEYGAESINKISDQIFYVLIQYLVETNKKNAEIIFHNRYFKNGIFGEPNGPDFNQVFKGLKQNNYQGYIGVISPMLKNISPEQVATIYYRKIKEKIEKIWLS
ncbi:MAG: sugar phosphate isomerase/epimerase family protein [Candidatus Omnitrophota bacterium]